MTLRAWAVVAIGLGLWFALVQASAQREPDAPTCKVLRVVDGDSIECELDGAKERVRLLGIDAPELQQQPFGARSAAALRELLPLQSNIMLDLDVRERDQYGRLLAHLWNEKGELVNEEMLRQGYAVVYVLPPNVKYADEFRTAARSAQLAKRGLWATSGFDCRPADFRQKRCK